MELFFGWVIFSMVVGFIASSKGRSAFGFFLLAIFLSPIIAGIIVLAVQNNSPAAVAARETATATAVSPRTHTKCPDCAELVLKEAKVCKHCGCRLVPQA